MFRNVPMGVLHLRRTTTRVGPSPAARLTIVGAAVANDVGTMLRSPGGSGEDCGGGKNWYSGWSRSALLTHFQTARAATELTATRMAVSLPPASSVGFANRDFAWIESTTLKPIYQ
ncbi:hypothetical protein BGY98DRAFT_1178165 [Russula aff. rugulosa BPL654]|nr:hypothetical protein BGY98DRAFT_1178165 [Russula aff. rugulosa BPL654]